MVDGEGDDAEPALADTEPFADRALVDGLGDELLRVADADFFGGVVELGALCVDAWEVAEPGRALAWAEVALGAGSADIAGAVDGAALGRTDVGENVGPPDAPPESAAPKTHASIPPALG